MYGELALEEVMGLSRDRLWKEYFATACEMPTATSSHVPVTKTDGRVQNRLARSVKLRAC